MVEDNGEGIFLVSCVEAKKDFCLQSREEISLVR
jgi:hypothetical protein